MNRIGLIVAAGLAMSASALAQNTGAILTDGTATFRIGGTSMVINTSPTTTGSPTMDLIVSGTSDNLFSDWWWFRVAGDTRELALANATSRVTTGTNEVEYGYAMGPLSATLNYKLSQPVANSGRVDQTLVISNPGAAAVQVDVFHYIDFDLAGLTSNTATLTTPNERMRVEHTGGTFADWWGNGANAYQVMSFATLRGLLTNTAIDNLNNTGLPFGPADWTGAYQWTLSVPAGGQVQVFSSYGVNTDAVMGGPPPCYADCDTSTGVGVLDIFDFLCFGNRFSAGDPYACDCDTSTGLGVCDIFDFLCFGNAFNAGCP